MQGQEVSKFPYRPFPSIEQKHDIDVKSLHMYIWKFSNIYTCEYDMYNCHVFVAYYWTNPSIEFHRVKYHDLTTGGSTSCSTLVYITCGQLYMWCKFLLYSIVEHGVVLNFTKVK